jgi:hypothetical protein
MFGSYNVHSIVATVENDPAADEQIAVFVAPKRCTIIGASATTANAVAGSETNYFSVNLVNKGTAGSGTAELATAIGGTAGWAALVPQTWTIDTDNDTVAAGEVIALDYDEEGTGTYGIMTVQIDYVLGDQ